MPARGILLLAMMSVAGLAVSASASASVLHKKPRAGHRRVSASRHATAVFSIGAGDTVTIRGGGGDRSNCTSDETDATFVTRGDDESHQFGFESRASGSCAFQRSYSLYKVTVKNADGKAIAFGDMFYGQGALYGPYGASCTSEGAWSGLTCSKTGDDSLKITLKRARALRGLRDTTIFAGATFAIPAGYTINVIGGGGGTSNCTRDETVTSFPTGGDERHIYQFVARDAGSCWYEFSWSDFRVELRDPSEGGRIIGKGIMWLGQLDPVIGYRASCENGPPKWSPQTGPHPRPYDWDRLKCTQTGSYEVKITRS